MPSPPIIETNPQTAVFPGAVAHDIDLMVATNRALSKIISPVDASQTQINVIDGSKFLPPCLIQIDTEVIRVGSKSGNSLFYCTRGFSNTIQANHGQNADVKGYVLAYHHNQMAAEIKAIEYGLGPNFENMARWVAPPVLFSSPGLLGQVSGDESYYYWHDGIRWQRVAIDATWV